MEPRSALLTSCAIALALTASAPGARALVVPFTGTLTIQLRPQGVQVPSLVVVGAGAALANGSSSGAHLRALTLAGSTFAAAQLVAPITDPSVFPIEGVQLTAHNGAGSFSGGGGGFGGTMPLFGSAKMCLFGACGTAVANLLVPLSAVGNGGAVFIKGGVDLTVAGAPWTTGTALVGAATTMGFVHGAASGTSSTATQGGRLRLVTPILISTNIADSQVIPAFGILDLHLVPEPATLALLTAGIAILCAIGRARRD